MAAYLHGNFSNVRMDIDSWTSGMRSDSDHAMSYSSGGQPPSIGDVRQIVVSESSGGSQMYSDGQPPSVNDVGRREPSQSERSYTRYDYPNSGEVDSSELGGGGGGGDRTLNRPRLVWTPQLHKRFVDAVAHLGIKNAVPQTIMQLMSVDGLTRENVATHLQRLYLKRMQGLSFGGNGSDGSGSGRDPATDHFFASSPVPPHFLNQLNSDNYLPYVPAAALQQQHHRVENSVHNFYMDDLEFAKEVKTLKLFPMGDD